LRSARPKGRCAAAGRARNRIAGRADRAGNDKRSIVASRTIALTADVAGEHDPTLFPTKFARADTHIFQGCAARKDSPVYNTPQHECPTEQPKQEPKHAEMRPANGDILIPQLLSERARRHISCALWKIRSVQRPKNPCTARVTLASASAQVRSRIKDNRQRNPWDHAQHVGCRASVPSRFCRWARSGAARAGPTGGVKPYTEWAAGSDSAQFASPATSPSWPRLL